MHVTALPGKNRWASHALRGLNICVPRTTSSRLLPRHGARTRSESPASQQKDDDNDCGRINRADISLLPREGFATSTVPASMAQSAVDRILLSSAAESHVWRRARLAARSDSLGTIRHGRPVWLKILWPLAWCQERLSDLSGMPSYLSGRLFLAYPSAHGRGPTATASSRE